MKKKVLSKPELAKPKPTNVYIWATIAGILGFILYLNTFGNGYVYDDRSAITNNAFVQQGISGIPKIFTVDFWHFENLKLGYYRPLAFVTFAIEHQFFGDSPTVGHFDNALLYGLTGFMLCLFLIQFFRSKHPAFALLITLIFIAHPIHTEAVANIKSRDEVLSFLNMILMLFFALKYQETKKTSSFILSLLFMYLALISKETGMIAIVLLPVFLFYSGNTIVEALKKSFPYAIVVIVFFLQKRYFLGPDSVTIYKDVSNYPYAADDVKLPSTLHIFALCLGLLIKPWPLSFDYSYNQIPASHFGDAGALLGALLFIGLAVLTVIGLMRKTTWGLGLAIILITIVPSMGFVYLRGGIMGERFLYAPALGFAILVVYLLSLASGKNINPRLALPEWLKKNAVLAGVGLIISLVFCIQTIARNKAWKDDLTLFGTDVKHVPGSCLAHKVYGNAVLQQGETEKDSIKRKADFDLGMNELRQAITIYPAFGQAYSNMGFGFSVVEVNMDSAIFYYKKCLEYAPGYAAAYYNIGKVYETKGNIMYASYYYNKAVEVNPQFTLGVESAAAIKKSTGLDVHTLSGEGGTDSTQNKTQDVEAIQDKDKKFSMYFQLGAEAVTKNDFEKGLVYFKKAAELSPDNKQNLIYLSNCYGITKHYTEAISTCELILKQDPNDQAVLKNLSINYDAIGEKAKADEIRKRLK